MTQTRGLSELAAAQFVKLTGGTVELKSSPAIRRGMFCSQSAVKQSPHGFLSCDSQLGDT
jgi:hypothetical protein